MGQRKIRQTDRAEQEEYGRLQADRALGSTLAAICIIVGERRAGPLPNLDEQERSAS